MKKHVKKLSLSRETLHHLASVAGGDFAVEIGGVDKNLSIPVCTNVISDCIYCTTPLNSCPPSMQTYCTCA